MLYEDSRRARYRQRQARYEARQRAGVAFTQSLWARLNTMEQDAETETKARGGGKARRDDAWNGRNFQLAGRRRAPVRDAVPGHHSKLRADRFRLARVLLPLHANLMVRERNTSTSMWPSCKAAYQEFAGGAGAAGRWRSAVVGVGRSVSQPQLAESRQLTNDALCQFLTNSLTTVSQCSFYGVALACRVRGDGRFRKPLAQRPGLN